MITIIIAIAMTIIITLVLSNRRAIGEHTSTAVNCIPPAEVALNLAVGDFERNGDISSRKMRVLAHFTIHMVEFIQLYTNQPHTWLGFRHHPSSSVFQPYIWLDTISNSWNNTK